MLTEAEIADIEARMRGGLPPKSAIREAVRLTAERCAEICEELRDTKMTPRSEAFLVGEDRWDGCYNGLTNCAAAIRRRAK